MRQIHRTGEKLFVNDAGPTVELADGSRAHILVAALGASIHTFACATPRETMTDWLWGCARALSFIGGVPQLIMPENPRAMIASLNRYGPRANETALQGFTMNALTGVTRNPWNTRLTPGGSSGGAAVSVAAGYAPLALATDGGGSIRRPAAYCGVAGFKPSAGLVPRGDGLPDLFLGHETVGGLARSVIDLRRLLATISARKLDTACAPRARLLFLPRLGSRPVDSRLVEATRRAAAQWVDMGHAVTEQPGAEWAEEVHALWPRLSATGYRLGLDARQGGRLA